MPNHCSNRAVVTGPVLHVTQFVDRSQVGKEGFQFQNIVPMPNELKGTQSPAVEPQTPEAKALIEKYGFSNWYDWHVSNWSTKWDCDTDGNPHWDLMGSVDRDDEEATIHYTTAWCPASNFWKEASRLYPKLTFKHEFSEPGMAFCGYEVFKAGERIESGDFDWNSQDGVTLRKSFGHEDCED